MPPKRPDETRFPWGVRPGEQPSHQATARGGIPGQSPFLTTASPKPPGRKRGRQAAPAPLPTGNSDQGDNESDDGPTPKRPKAPSAAKGRPTPKAWAAARSTKATAAKDSGKQASAAAKTALTPTTTTTTSTTTIRTPSKPAAKANPPSVPRAVPVLGQAHRPTPNKGRATGPANRAGAGASASASARASERPSASGSEWKETTESEPEPEPETAPQLERKHRNKPGPKPKATTSSGFYRNLKGSTWPMDQKKIVPWYNLEDLRLYTEPKFSDITIVSIKRDFRAHKNILAMRSTWFEKKCMDIETAMLGKIDLQSEPAHLVEAMLKFIYAGALDPTEFNLEKGTFTRFVEIVQLASRFELEKTMGVQALNLLGQHCDKQLTRICSYDSALCKRGDGVLDAETDPVLANDKFVPDLLNSIKLAYRDHDSTPVKDILLGFVWASRAHVLQCRHDIKPVVAAAGSATQANGNGSANGNGNTNGNTNANANTSAGNPPARTSEHDVHNGCFHGLSLQLPQFSGDFFRLMVGNGSGNSWVPGLPRNGILDASSVGLYSQPFAMDHKRKTQHPDRCLCCRLVFGEGETIKAVYNPFYAQTRPTAYCYECVTKNDGLIMWREVVVEDEAAKEAKEAKETK